jgi:hypothetical protein
VIRQALRRRSKQREETSRHCNQHPESANKLLFKIFISASCKLQLGKLDWIDSRSKNEPFQTAKRKSTFQQKVTNKTKNKKQKQTSKTK